MKKTLGGDRLGAGKKQEVELHGYERSTHNMSYLWRSTMAAGTLVPFICEVALPGDTFDIDLNTVVLTHPTIGPLFGSYKVQLDVFQAPIRLYQGQLHNNKLGIGRNMANIKLPLMKVKATKYDANISDTDNAQINPSCLLSYLGLRGVGIQQASSIPVIRYINGVPLLAYWDIYKNYYANKQEEIGVVIHTDRQETIETVDQIAIEGSGILPEQPATPVNYTINIGQLFDVQWTGTEPLRNQIIIRTNKGEFTIAEICQPTTSSAGHLESIYQGSKGTLILFDWRYKTNNELVTDEIELLTFPLENIDTMREQILANAVNSTPFIINDAGIGAPYDTLLNFTGSTQELNPMISTQEGLAVKTYQSDLLNNWLNTEWIDGSGGISEVTAVDTSGGSFTIDTLNLTRKVYNMLNRIVVSGGSYDDWLDAVYTHDRYVRCESPIYHGGLSKELVFQEVISNTASNVEAVQPLGTLAGRGTMHGKHKGGHVTIKVDEPSYIIALASLTPRTDYSQGNKWDTGLKTMDDLHKPALDEIGFQELITEQAAWWDTQWDDVNSVWVQKSAGKQPAWINYMTNINQTRGNFAILQNEMFMTLNRRYTPDNDISNGIKDMTTYIDPSKFNFIFAQTSLDSQNFWTQIAVNMEVRRKMSAKVMPNL